MTIEKNHGEYEYLKLMQHVQNNGNMKDDRTGTGTKSVFGYQMRFDLSEGFPLLTTKKLHLKSIIHELLWFLNGDTNIKYLKDNGVKIWDDWANEDGELGPVYGEQWRTWKTHNGETIDQITNLINLVKKNPNSRRMIVSAWNPAVLPDPETEKDFALNISNGKQALPPCHCFFQFYVHDDKLSIQLYQRSADIFLGVPFNIASYSLLLMMVAQSCGLKAHELIHTLGDAHLYNNHLEQAELQLSREPYPFPKMKINPNVTDIFDFKFEDFELVDYISHPHIPAPIAK